MLEHLKTLSTKIPSLYQDFIMSLKIIEYSCITVQYIKDNASLSSY